MLPSKFCEFANFPERWQEKHLQEYIGKRLQEFGFQVQLEIKANGGRADIVTNWQGGAIIEVKKFLDRNTIYQAVGQLQLYGLNNKRKLIAIGFLPTDVNEQKSAVTTASMVKQNPRISVIFINLEQEWLPNTRVSKSWKWDFKFPSLPKISWIDLIKTHPMIVVLIIGLMLAAIHQTPTSSRNLQPASESLR